MRVDRLHIGGFLVNSSKYSALGVLNVVGGQVKDNPDYELLLILNEMSNDDIAMS